ncbi:MAG: phosphoenolpyruvate--protein phosphotransferase, partial [Myxococcota bacterium]|nr:phosphoenolpyruvate--protein phosphotransferase [Myxococcota bacterium]
DEIKNTLASLGDDYFKERAQDVDFVGTRVLRNLLGHATEIVDAAGGPCIIIADVLSPTDTTHMVDAPVMGFATEVGTRTSHTAIMAQALGIPAVVGVESLAERVSTGDTVIVDGLLGVIVIRPDAATIAEYRERAARHAESEKSLLAMRDEPARTLDNVDLTLLANIEFPAEAAMALDYGAMGVGLYRTEFLYLDRKTPPSEEEQYRIYRTVVEAMSPRPIIVRTFDLGADKLAPGQENLHEANPALGLRAVRLGLKNRGMFKAQLRALLRAAKVGPLKIMVPMISGVGELRQVKALLEEARKELGSEAAERVPLGCMIELPSAVFVADMLAREVDFFSIGTNDLIQYAMAIDRGNDHVAYLYTPFHPGVLRAIYTVLQAAEAAGIDVAMCGNMAAEALLVPVLLGMGLRTFSMAPTSIPAAKAMIRKISVSESVSLAQEVLNIPTATEVEDRVRRHLLGKLGPDFNG